MTTWGYDFGDPELLRELGGGSVDDKKQKVLIKIRDLNAKAVKIRVLTRDHFNSGRWDTWRSGNDVARLLDEAIDLAADIRKDLT